MNKVHTGLVGLFLAVTPHSFASLPVSHKIKPCAYIPKTCGGFRFEIDALYLKPSLPYLDYALKYHQNSDGTPTGVVPEDGLYYSVNPDYGWGYYANIGYVFPCTANDITVAYTRLKFRDSDAVSSFPDFTLYSAFFSGGSNDIGVTDVDVIFPGELPFILPVTLSVPITQASMRVRFDYRAWDLEFGQDVNAGCAFQIHWLGGLRFSQLDQQIQAVYTGSNSAEVPTGLLGSEALATVNTNFSLKNKSEYQGIGPRFGSHLTYQITPSFGIVTELSGALLVGDVNSSYTDLLAQDVIAELIPVDPEAPPIVSTTLINSVFSFKHTNTTRIVPNLEGKLGIRYSYRYCQNARSLFKIEAGWSANHYFNAFDRLSGVGADGPGFRTRNTTDVSFDGPYLGLQVTI